jgi:protein bicaudal C
MPQNNNVCIDAQPNEGGMFNMTTTNLDPAPQRNQLSKYIDVETLLTNVGQQHHVQHFIDGEVDMSVFQTLNEQDLINLGIKPLGARRRIMMAVHEMKSRKNMQQELMESKHTTPTTPLCFNGSSAPGDERSSSGH